jgi:protein TonB
MFQHTFVDARQGRKPWLAVVSFLGQMFLVFLLILTPLIYTESLPRAPLASFLVMPPPAPPPPPAPAPAQKMAKAIPRQYDLSRLMAPRQIPREIADTEETLTPPPNSSGVPGSVVANDLSAGPGGLGIFGAAPAPALPPVVKAASLPLTPQRIRVGGIVQQANLTRKVQPVYPPLAKQARIQGAVHFTAIIGKDGAIRKLQLVGGHPLLVEAARNAVSQWQYKPTLLNGEPVEVVTEIDVNFALTQ